MAKFTDILPRLVAAYESGRLVPFIGSGMSIPAAASWKGLVENLEREADVHIQIKPTSDSNPKRTQNCKPDPRPEELIRRANAAVRSLRAQGQKTLISATAKATFEFDGKVTSIPEQTAALAEIDWPLVLTTNYDNLFESAFHRSRSDDRASFYNVVGRSQEDCQRILNSLSVAGRALVWALQGYLHQPECLPDANLSSRLDEQIVIGHEEYRRVTYREIHFRRAFAEVFRQRSLLFLGSGLRDPYLQELFGEVLELFGPSTRPHYALLSQGDGVDDTFLDFMLSRFQIVVATYEKGRHKIVIDHLKTLKKAIKTLDNKQVVWAWGGTAAPKRLGRGGPVLEVVRRPLRVSAADDKHCLAISAIGGDGNRFLVSNEIEDTLVQWGLDVKQNGENRHVKIPEWKPGIDIGYDKKKHVFAVRSAAKKQALDLTDVYEASLALLRIAGSKYDCIHAQLLAAGERSQVDGRLFPARFSFVQMVRAFAQWRREHSDEMCKFIIYLEEPTVSRDLASGRIDVAELLICEDLRFWVEVVFDSGDVDRRLFQEKACLPLRDIVRKMNLPQYGWEFSVTPPPELKISTHLISKSTEKRRLDEIGILPGSTIHFQPPARDVDSGPQSA
jgi:SIR2-like domain